MYIKIQISNKVYQQMVAGGNRVQGSIGLTSPKEGNFNAWMKSAPSKDEVVHKLAHGRVRINTERTLVSLRFDHRTERVNVSSAIRHEADEASVFARDMELIDFI